jgi:hypothetical protein
MFEEIAKNQTLVGIGVVVTFVCGIPILISAITRVHIFWKNHHTRILSLKKEYENRLELSALRADEIHTYFASLMWLKLIRAILHIIYYFVLREFYKLFRDVGSSLFGYNPSIDLAVKSIFFFYFFVVGAIVVATLYEMAKIARSVKRKHSNGLEGD